MNNFELTFLVRNFDYTIDYNKYEKEGVDCISERIELKAELIENDFKTKSFSIGDIFKIYIRAEFMSDRDKHTYFDDDKGRFISFEEYEKERDKRNDYVLGGFYGQKHNIDGFITLPNILMNKILFLLKSKKSVYLTFYCIKRYSTRLPFIRDVYISTK